MGSRLGIIGPSLTIPIELYERFKEQVERGRGGDDEFHPMDISFIEAMEYGMPPTTGLGPGIERLVMMFTESDYIDDILFFPMMRPAQITANQKEIYGEEYLVDPTLSARGQVRSDEDKQEGENGGFSQTNHYREEEE